MMINSDEQNDQPERPILPEQDSPLNTSNWDNRAFLIPGTSRKAMPKNPKPAPSRGEIAAPRYKRVKLPRVND